MCAASLEIQRSLIVPCGHCPVALESIGLTQVCDTSLSGVWVLEATGLVSCRRT